MGINTLSFMNHECSALLLLSQFTIQTSSPCRQHAWPENMHRNWLNFFVFIDFRKILLEDTLSPASQPSSGKRTCPRSPAAWSSWAACRQPRPLSSSGCWTWEASRVRTFIWNEVSSLAFTHWQWMNNMNNWASFGFYMQQDCTYNIKSSLQCYSVV